MNAASASGLSSALYEGSVWHERRVPRAHRFCYGLFYLALDLDELPRLARECRWLGVNRSGIMSFWERDYLPVSIPSPSADIAGAPAGATLKQRVITWCERQGLALDPDVRVMLVTLPRIFGYAFNPVSFYFCLDRSGRPQAAIAEVTNTFREVKPYLVPVRTDAAGGVVCHRRVAKHFYVSPFSGLDVAFDFTLRTPAERLAITIDDYEGATQTLHSALTGRRRLLTDARLLTCLVRYPLLSLRVIGLIHWEAFRLWLKRVPHYRKAADPDRQRDLLRPHASLRPRVS